MRTLIAVLMSTVAMAVRAQAQEQRRPVLEWQGIRACEGKFGLECVRRAVRLPSHEAGTVQVIQILEKKDDRGIPGNSHSTGAYWRDAFLAALPEFGGVGLVIQSNKGATLSVWEPHRDRYEKVVLWGQDIQRLDEEIEIVFVAWQCSVLGCESGRVLHISVWGRGDVGPLKARSLVPKVQEVLGIEKFQLNLGSNPRLWGVSAAVPLMVPALGVLGVDGLRKVHTFNGTICEPTLSGLRANCY